jgi:enterochelin esterase family protein
MNYTIQIPSWAKFIVSDFTDMDRNPQAVTGMSLSFALPEDAYFEYGFLDAEGGMKADPNNAVKADNPWFPNASAIFGPTYQASPYANPKAEAKAQVLRLRIESRYLKQTRRIIVYSPENHTGPLPVIYVQDGIAYYRIAQLAEVLEQLLQEQKVRPAHLVFIEPIDRVVEYRFNPDYHQFIVEELVPKIDSELKSTSERIAMGASLGGLASSVLALENPDLFQTVISQSGAFLGSPEEPDFYKSQSSWVLDTLQQRDHLPLRWYSEVGTLEWLTAINRKVHKVLLQKGYDHLYQERPAGHNWVNWRNGLAEALTFALNQASPAKL